MVFASLQTILCILLLLGPVVSVRSQSTVDKAATSTVSGKVTIGGKGLSGVVVGLVISDQFRSNFRPTRFRSITDEDGKYRITKVPPGTYEVITASPIFIPTEGRKSLIVGKNETVENIDITLERGGVITGKVTDADGMPLIEERVYISPATSTQQLPYFQNVRTDDRGIYRAYGVPSGSYKVFAGTDANSSIGSRRAEGYERTYHPSVVDPAAATVIEVSEGTEAINIDIKFGGPTRTYSARGRIIHSDTDQPMPNTPVGVQTFFEHGGSATSNVAVSTKNGEFTLENLAPGKYAVYSEPPAGSDLYSERVQFEVTDRDVEGLLIKTSKGASVSGVVVLDGTDDTQARADLLAGRIVGQIVDDHLGRSDPSAAINPNGSFRITGLAPGRLMLHPERREKFRMIRLERDGIVYPRGVEIKEREQVTGLRVVVAHANGSIRGVIKLASGLELPATARVHVLVSRNEEPAPRSYTPIQVDTRGQFRVESLIPGTYELVASGFTNASPDQPRQIPPMKQTVVVTSGAVTDVTITLQMPRPRPQ